MQKSALRIARLAALALLPLAISWATSTPPVGRTGAPGETTCSACHGGAGTGSLGVASTSGMINYTPGASKHFTVTVAGTGGNAGFTMTARPASNLSGGVAGNLVAGATTQVLCKVGTACATGNPQYIRSVAATPTTAVFDFDWTAPTGTEDVTLYVAGVVGYTGNTYTATYLLKAGSASPPTLSVTPGSLSFSYQIGGTAPAAQTLAISGAATTYTVATAGGTWLTATPTSGGTSGSASVAVSTTGLAAGSYSGSVTVTAAGSTGSPLTIPVTLNVTAATPALAVSPASLSFAYQVGGSVPAAQSLAISGAATTYTVTAAGGTWLSVTPASGGTSGSAAVSVNPATLAAGTYSGTVTITAPGSTGSPKAVPVTLTVTPAATSNLTVSPASLSFAYQLGGVAPTAQTLAISGVASTYTATAAGGTWLSVTPASGGTSGTATVSVNTASLAAGTYNGTVTITAAGSTGSPKAVPVTLTVTAAPTSLTLTPASLAFAFQLGGTAPAAQTLNINGVSSTYTVAASGGTWLTMSPTSGGKSGTATVRVNTAGLAIGSYSGSITVTAAGTTGSPKSVPVTLTVAAAAPTLTVSPTSINFAYQISGTLPSSRTLVLRGVATTYTAVAAGGAWLTVSPVSGGTSSSPRVSVNVTGLAAGTYTGSVSITAPGSNGSPKLVPVTLTVTPPPPPLTASPSPVSFTYQLGDPAPAPQSLAISAGTLTYTTAVTGATWLTVAPASGTSPGSANLTVNTTGLAAGTYTGTVTITAPGAANRTLAVPVTLTVTVPSLQIAPATLAFSYTAGGPTPVAQVFSVASSGTTLNYSVTTSGEAWLTAAPVNGATPGTLFVSVNPANLVAGTYTATVTVTSLNYTNKPQALPVTLAVVTTGPVCPAP